MDKQKNRNTITIKINGKTSPFQENNIEKPSNNQKKEQEQSQLSKAVELEAAAARELVDEDDSEQFEWILPETNKGHEIKEYHSPSDTKQPKTKFKKILPTKKGFSNRRNSKINITMVLAIFFAVLLGTFFGLMLLKIVPATSTIQENPPIVEEEQKPNPPAKSGSVDITIKPLAFSVVQEGIYSSAESAENSKGEVIEKGIPAEVFSTNEQFAIFIGVADNLETAKSIGNTMKTSEIDTYAKEFTIGEKTIKNLHEEEKELLELSSPLFQTLLTGVTTASSSKNIPKEVLDQYKSQASTFEKLDKSKLQNKEVAELFSHLEAAVAQFKIYEKTPNSSTLNMIQQHLLTFLANYQKL